MTKDGGTPFWVPFFFSLFFSTSLSLFFPPKNKWIHFPKKKTPQTPKKKSNIPNPFTSHILSYFYKKNKKSKFLKKNTQIKYTPKLNFKLCNNHPKFKKKKTYILNKIIKKKRKTGKRGGGPKPPKTPRPGPGWEGRRGREEGGGGEGERGGLKGERRGDDPIL